MRSELQTRRKAASRAVAAIVLVILSGVSLVTGVSDLGLDHLAWDDETVMLLLVSRLPRTLAALLAGSSLAVAGMIMQLLSRNRFVEPTTAGTGECAALGLLVVTVLFPTTSVMVKMLAASLAAFAGTACFLAMANRLPPTQPLLVPLVGIAFGGIVMAVVTFVAYQTDLLQYVGVWANGEFSGVVQGRYELLWASAALTFAAFLTADQFTIVGLGREASINLGLSYRQVLLLGLLIVSFITAFTVTTIGMLPFVGLVIPNIVSRFKGDSLRGTLPWIAFSGGTLVLTCDILGRLIRYPYEIPVGTVFGVLGTALFLWLLLSPPRHAA